MLLTAGALQVLHSKVTDTAVSDPSTPTGKAGVERKIAIEREESEKEGDGIEKLPV